MSKLYFHTINNNMMELINEANKIAFVSAREQKTLKKACDKLIADRDDLRAVLILEDGSEDREVFSQVSELEKKINVLESKRASVRKWANDTLFGYNDGTGKNKVHVDGLYEKILGDDLYKEYVNAQDSWSYTSFTDKCRELIVDRLGVECDSKKLVDKFVRKLEHACGIVATNGTGLVKGDLIKNMSSKKFHETFYRALIDGMKGRCESLELPTTVDSKAIVFYDGNLKVSGYELVEPDTDNNK